MTGTRGRSLIRETLVWWAILFAIVTIAGWLADETFLTTSIPPAIYYGSTPTEACCDFREDGYQRCYAPRPDGYCHAIDSMGSRWERINQGDGR